MSRKVTIITAVCVVLGALFFLIQGTRAVPMDLYPGIHEFCVEGPIFEDIVIEENSNADVSTVRELR